MLNWAFSLKVKFLLRIFCWHTFFQMQLITANECKVLFSVTFPDGIFFSLNHSCNNSKAQTGLQFVVASGLFPGFWSRFRWLSSLCVFNILSSFLSRFLSFLSSFLHWKYSPFDLLMPSESLLFIFFLLQWQLQEWNHTHHTGCVVVTPLHRLIWCVYPGGP